VAVPLTEHEEISVPFIPIEEAQSRLAELIHSLVPGDEVFITENDHPVARLTITPRPRNTPRPLGTLKGTVLYMDPDFNAPMDFEDNQ
jgi:antitoxin (DNA-binding transcriptional repressor) of toxin-antitoxin stability system